MEFNETKINGVFIITIEPSIDDRGMFVRTFCKDEFKKITHHKEFVQTNFSYTKSKGTIRGMHYQVAPKAETKLIRCIRGRVCDVVVDLRKNSSTFLEWFSVELSKEKMNMIYIPEGCAHGFQTLENNCELIYNHTAKYSPEFEKNFSYKDNSVNIIWPLEVTNISERDANAPKLQMNLEI